MTDRMHAFLRDESGAATIDWVVLTAAVSFLSLAVVIVFVPATERLGTRIATRIDTVSP